MALELGDVTTATINVKHTDHTLYFSKDGGSNWYEKPINWNPLSTNTSNLTITWAFGPGVSGVSTSSANITVDPTDNKKWSVNSTGGGDPFTVTKSDGGIEDPIIIVTPQ